MKNKKMCLVALLLVLQLCLSACSNEENLASNEEVIVTVDDATDESAEDEASEDQYVAELEEPSDASGTYYDLTEMSSEMVYAVVYNIMSDPDAFLGATMRISGVYYASYFEATDAYYHFCVISDASACCAQGMEFIWGDGTHSYPDEYPEEYADIIVEGTFGSYEELGVTYYGILDAEVRF